MKRRIALIGMIVSLLVAGAAFGESFGKNGMLVDPGSFNGNVGVGMGYGLGAAVGGGAEYSFGKIVIADKYPLTYGAGGRVGIAFGSSSTLSLGVIGTLHFSLDALDLPSDLEWARNFDFYTGIGLAVLPSIGFYGMGGTSYFLSKNLAINIESGIFASYLGVLFSL